MTDSKCCRIAGCERENSKAELCWSHYKRKINHGSPLPHIPIRQRILSKRQVSMRTYRSWNSMRHRCNTPSDKSFKNYGGRGIKVCKRWGLFDNFLKDMGKRPPGKTIDRINNDGGYCPSNCRWATRGEQNKNRRPVNQWSKRA